MGGTILAIGGGKGGVGRTTVALNLGAALEAAGYNAAVADLDLAMTDLDVQLDIDVDVGVHDVLAGEAGINDAMIEREDGLAIAPGNPALSAFADADEEKVAHVIEPLGAAHDVVIVDTEASLSPLHREVFGLAHGVIVVTNDDEAAISNAAKSAEVVQHVGSEVLGVVVSQATPSDLDPVRAAFDEPLFTIPEDGAIDAETVPKDGAGQYAFEQLAEAVGHYHDEGFVPADAGQTSTADAGEPVSAAEVAGTDEDATVERSETTAAIDDESNDSEVSADTATAAGGGDAEATGAGPETDPLETLLESGDDADEGSESSGSRIDDLADRVDPSGVGELADRVREQVSGGDDAADPSEAADAADAADAASDDDGAEATDESDDGDQFDSWVTKSPDTGTAESSDDDSATEDEDDGTAADNQPEAEVSATSEGAAATVEDRPASASTDGGENEAEEDGDKDPLDKLFTE